MKKYNTVEDYICLLKKEGIERFIEYVKESDLLVNPYSGKMNANKREIIEILTKTIHEMRDDFLIGEWSNLLDEVEQINEVYKKFYDNPLNKIVQTENPLEAFMLVTEQFLQYVNNILNDEEEKNMEMGLNFIVNENEQIERKKFYMELHDILTREINMVFSSLRFYRGAENGIDTDITISGKEINCAYKHFVNVQLNDIINYAVNVWKHGGRTVRKIDDKVFFDFTSNLDESYFIINERNDARANKAYLSVAQIMRDFGGQFAQGRELSKFVDLDELMTCYYLLCYLNADTLDKCTYSVKGIEFANASIRELVRAYYLLIEVSRAKINSRKREPNNLKNWAVILEKQDIYALFSNNGIKHENINAIIMQLTYRKGIDIFDAPLIENEGKYILLPNLLMNVDISKIVLSLASEINTRGLLFEEEIRKRIKEKGFASSDLYFKDVEEYQCDLVLAIADDLYICECKAWNDFTSINGYCEMRNKMADAKEQLDRIARKFSEEIEYVNNRLGFEKTHKFKNIRKLVITLNMLGLDRKIGDVYFVDFSCLMKFLDREKPGRRLYGKHSNYIPFKGFNEYEGTINNYKFMKMIENPCNIQLTRKNKIVGENIFLLDGLEVHIPMYVPAHDTILFVKAGDEWE